MSESGDGGDSGAGDGAATGWLAGLIAANEARNDPAAQRAIVDFANAGLAEAGLSLDAFRLLGLLGMEGASGVALRAAVAAARRAEEGAANLVSGIARVISSRQQGAVSGEDAIIQIVSALQGTEPAARAVVLRHLDSFAEGLRGGDELRSDFVDPPLSYEAQMLLDVPLVQRFAKALWTIVRVLFGESYAGSRIDESGELVPDARLTAPVPGAISQGYDLDIEVGKDAEGHPVYGAHRGDDYSGSRTDPIHAAASGIIFGVYQTSDESPFARMYKDIPSENGELRKVRIPGVGPDAGTIGNGLGNHVAILHYDGTISIYGHLERGSVPSGLAAGVPVPRGGIVGQMGNSGNVGTVSPYQGSDYQKGVHLHFEVRTWDLKSGTTTNTRPRISRPV